MTEEEKLRQVESKLDERWYGRFSEATSLSTADYLSTDPQVREIEKEKFLDGETVNPGFKRSKEIGVGELNIKVETLLELKRDIIKNEPSEVVAQAYRWRINEKIADLFLLESAIEGDMRKFKKWSEFIFGKPSKEVFDYSMGLIRVKVSEGLASDKAEIQDAARVLQEVLGESVFSTSGTLKSPGEEEISLAREVTLNEFYNIINLESTNPEKIFNSMEIKEYFERILEALQTKDWTIIIDKGITSVSVGQENKTISIPENKQMKINGLNELVIHELGTHALRRENGERSKLMLLGLGLDRYLKGEEGIATVREMLLDDTVEDFAGFNEHLAISLAYGYDGKPRDFRGVYGVMQKYYFLKYLLNGKDSEKAMSLSNRNAWNMAIRIFMGTDYKTPGVCYTKDIVYREGSIGVWNVIRENPAEMLRFSVGKYDPANTRHIWILTQLGINDADLQTNIAE